MFRTGRLTPLLLAAGVLALPALASAQSGRTQPTPTPTPKQQEASQTTSDVPNLEKVKVIESRGFVNFVKDLNEQGRVGYRLEKSVGYGGKGADQTYAAVLRLDPGHVYEYDWLSSPNRDLLDLRLNTLAKKGFYFADAYPLTACSDDSSEDADDRSTVSLSLFKFLKGNVFLFERRDGAAAQNREYKFFVGKIGPGKNPKETIQVALDSAPAGFRPVKLLFSKSGWFDFRVSVLVERDLSDAAPAKVEYGLVKEVSGFEKEVNALAARGFRFIGGGRMGTVNFGMLARQAADATAYTFIDDEKHAKEFDKTIAAGNVYHGLLEGDLRCDESEVANQKLVFSRSNGVEKREYRIVSLLEPKTRQLSAAALEEFRRLVGEGFRARDIFYARGLNVIFEK